MGVLLTEEIFTLSRRLIQTNDFTNYSWDRNLDKKTICKKSYTQMGESRLKIGLSWAVREVKPGIDGQNTKVRGEHRPTH